MTPFHNTFHRLQILTLSFIIQNVGNILSRNFIFNRPVVDARHGHTDGPWCVSNGDVQIPAVCFKVRAIDQTFHNFSERVSDVNLNLPHFHGFDERTQVGCGLNECTFLFQGVLVQLRAPTVEDEIYEVSDDFYIQFCVSSVFEMQKKLLALKLFKKLKKF